MKRRSLRAKLLLVLLLVIVAFWLTFSCVFIGHMTREQSEWLDKSLRDVAHRILASLPEDVSRLSSESRLLRAPGEAETVTHELSFQIWSAGGDGLIRSRESPESPLRPGFEPGFAFRDIDGHPWRIYSVTDTTGRVHVQTGMPMDRLESEFHEVTRVIMFVALTLFLVLSATLWMVVSWFTRPLTRLQHEITARQEFDLAPLSLAGLPVEVKPLIESFNRLLIRIDKAVANERRFIADAAHELRTPMAAVQTHAQVALHATDPEETRAALNRLIDAVERGTRLAQQLLDSARLESGNEGYHEALDLAELVSMVTHEFDTGARRHGQTVSLKARSCMVNGNLDELGILVRNLLDNAMRYSGEGSRIEIQCRKHREDGSAILSISDNGPGVPDEQERRRLFERFFRAEGNGQRGSGIGLSLVRRIAESHGAQLNIDTGLDERGLTISLQFPPVEDGQPS